MEMDSSRRSFDRSREPGLKKARLVMDEPDVRQFQQRPTMSGSNLIQSRYGMIERDMDGMDSGSDGGYQPQPLPQHQQHQELVEQYRTALAELTFNSKPIITNLTIIAGENQHAAKSIAATICAHIVEVPSDQKLPSLYLLDSIVKNIGRDYIKYFAARLPEVFGRAYRQVDPPVHTSMKHLFGTWKGVFHPQMLQNIEKELGFGSAANGSSGPAASRSEPQSQRPAHSIHVNPKYLERQRLQQSVRPKSILNDMGGALGNLSKDAERLERTSGVSSGRLWMDTPAKTPSIQHPQRGTLHDPIREKNIGVVYVDPEYGLEMSRNSLGTGRGGNKVIEQGQGQGKPWYGAGGQDATETNANQRNGFPMKNRVPPTYPQPKSSNVEAQLLPIREVESRTGGSTNWKNSEEEEFMWDSIDSRSSDHGTANNISSIARRDTWTSDGSEKPGFGNNIRKRALDKSGLSDGYPATLTETKTPGSSLTRGGMGRSSHVRDAASIGFSGATTSSESPGVNGQQRISSVGTVSPSGHSPVHQHSPSPSDVTRYPRKADPRTSNVPGKSTAGTNNRYSGDPFKLKAVEVKKAGPTTLPSQLKQEPPMSRQSQLDQALPENFGQLKKPFQSQGKVGKLPVSHGSSLPSTLATSSASEPSPSMKDSSNPFADLLSSLVSKGLISAAKTESSPPVPSQTHKQLSNENQDVLSSLLAKGLISAPKAESLPSVPSQLHTLLPNESQDVLSSLLAKGLISAPKIESSPSITFRPSKQLHNERQDVSTASPVSSVSIPTSVPGSTTEEVTKPEPAGRSSDLPQTPAVEIKNLIGYEFKADTIRRFHSSVVDDLLEDLPHCCGICGLRLKLKERLDRHLVWHASQDPEQKGKLNVSDKWYAKSADWVAGRIQLPAIDDVAVQLEETGEDTAMVDEPMVPADENQCACLLCGELFEDTYSIEQDEWMFRGAMYMALPYNKAKLGSENESKTQGPIVHAKCLSENSVQDLFPVTSVKMEVDA